MSKVGLDVYFDRENCIREIEAEYEWALDKLGEIFLSLLKIEALKTRNGSVAGKPEWREDMRSKMKIISKDITKEHISVKVGIDESDLIFTEFIRAMVVAAGSGSKAGNPPIEAGPMGRIVFNDNLDRQHASQVEDQYTLPEEFNQKGNEFLYNALTRMKTYYPRYLNALKTRIQKIVKKNITIIGTR